MKSRGATPASFRIDAWDGFLTRAEIEIVFAIGSAGRVFRIEPPLLKVSFGEIRKARSGVVRKKRKLACNLLRRAGGCDLIVVLILSWWANLSPRGEVFMRS